jgi:Ser/Thr protein kinase RdoA (MazF antagonist)
MEHFEQLSESDKVDRYARLAQKALAAYGLRDARLTGLRSETHTVFEVRTGDSSRHYALRICPREWPVDALEREILWLAALCRDTELVLPEPILSLDGKLIQKVSSLGVPGLRPCVLFHWVDGRSLDSELAAGHLNGVGRLLARLHVHAETFRWPEEIALPRRNVTMIRELLDDRLLRTRYAGSEIDLFHRAIDRITETMLRLGDGPTVAGAIHGDLRRSHLRFEGTEARALGFDACRWGYYAYDLAVVRSWIERRENREELVAAFAEGYGALRDLPEEIGEAVPIFAALHAIDRIRSLLARPDRAGHSAFELGQEFDRVREAVEAR